LNPIFSALIIIEKYWIDWLKYRKSSDEQPLIQFSVRCTKQDSLCPGNRSNIHIDTKKYNSEHEELILHKQDSLCPNPSPPYVWISCRIYPAITKTVCIEYETPRNFSKKWKRSTGISQTLRENDWELHAYLVILLRQSQKLMNLDDLKIATIDMHAYPNFQLERRLEELETQL
jgi:hypothetical protein